MPGPAKTWPIEKIASVYSIPAIWGKRVMELGSRSGHRDRLYDHRRRNAHPARSDDGPDVTDSVSWCSADLGPDRRRLLLSDQFGAGLGVLAWGALVVNPADNILKPLLISNATDIPLVIALFGVLGGLVAFGMVGLFLGPLILAILLAIWREWMEDDRPEPASPA
jgi:AI-2E family transporter